MAEKPPPAILVVDDTEASRYAVSRILRQARFSVHEAATGADGLRLAGTRPDLIILDVNLPDMSGYDLCRRIKTDPATAAIPVLHLSASFIESEDRSQGLEYGADGYLVYPLEPRELLAHIRALLRVREAERAARAQRELLHVTLSSIGDGVIATDAQGAITFINPVAQVLIGCTEAEVVGKPLDAVFHTANEGGNREVLIARDGARHPIDVTVSPIRDGEGQFVGKVLVFRDVTERRRLEADLRQRSEDLAERDRRKDEFLAMLAHELRNPLAPIRNSLQYLRMKLAGDPDVERVGAMLARQVGQMARLVDDLLDMARISQGKIELRIERVSLAVAVSQAVETVRPIFDERHHHLEVSLPAEPLSLQADLARLAQVVGNLLTNAAKYTPPGGRIELVSLREGEEVEVRVRDNGIGIRAEMLPHIFDLFTQADRVPGRVSEGLGIGLTLVRNLIELHGGRVSASSPGPGLGSTFVIRLPALPDRAEERPRKPTEATHPAAPVRVLVTDDNVDAAESLAVLLRLLGHDARTAHDGQAALTIARTFRPQVVFLDIGLPRGMDGYEVARQLRREPGLEGVLLVAMTGYGQPEDVARAGAAGMDHHVTKPADLGVIQRLLAGVQTLAPS